MNFGYFESPLGLIEIAGTSHGIVSLDFIEKHCHETTMNPIIKKTLHQLEMYFIGTRKIFDIPICLIGTDFQKRVWRNLLNIPFGKTVSYQDVACAIDHPRACRAVGAANGKNPIALIVPCHRVIGSNGSLTGYGGGLWRKEWLLRHESALGQPSIEKAST